MNTNAITDHASQVPAINLAQLQERAKALRLMGLLAHWETLQGDPVRLGWTKDVLDWEESERAQRSLERRLRAAHIGRFKPLADFDWDWPTHCDRMAVQELMTLSFMADASADHRRLVQEPLAGGVVLQMDQAAFADQKIPGHQRERREDPNLVRRLHLRAHRHRQEGASTRCLALCIATDSFGLSFRENPACMRLADLYPNSRNTGWR